MTPEQLTKLFNPSQTQDEGLHKVFQAGVRAGLEAVRDKYKEIRLDGYPTHYGILRSLQDWLDVQLKETGA